MTRTEAIRAHPEFQYYARLGHVKPGDALWPGKQRSLDDIAQDVATRDSDMRLIKQAIRNAAKRTTTRGRPKKPDPECTVQCAHCGRENIITIARQ